MKFIQRYFCDLRIWYLALSVQFTSVTQSCPTLCDPMNRSTPGLPVHHQLPEFTQTHVHWVSDAIQPSHLCRPLLYLVLTGVKSLHLLLGHISCIFSPLTFSFFTPKIVSSDHRLPDSYTSIPKVYLSLILPIKSFQTLIALDLLPIVMFRLL